MISLYIDRELLRRFLNPIGRRLSKGRRYYPPFICVPLPHQYIRRFGRMSRVKMHVGAFSYLVRNSFSLFFSRINQYRWALVLLFDRALIAGTRRGHARLA